MPTPLYVHLETKTLASNAAAVTFSSIPSTSGGAPLRDLVLSMNTDGAGAFAAFQLTFNGDTGDNYNYVFMRGDGSSATSGNAVGTARIQTYGTVNEGVAIASVMDYSATDKHKSVLIRYGSDAVVSAVAARWGSTAAITSLTITGNYTAGTTFTLYATVGE